MNALENVFHFVAIITDLQQLEFRWVELETYIFQYTISEGRKDAISFKMISTDEMNSQMIESNYKNALL